MMLYVSDVKRAFKIIILARRDTQYPLGQWIKQVFLLFVYRSSEATLGVSEIEPSNRYCFLFVCLFVCLLVCLSVCSFVCCCFYNCCYCCCCCSSSFFSSSCWSDFCCCSCFVIYFCCFIWGLHFSFILQIFLCTIFTN